MGLQSSIAIPLISNDRVIGTLHISSTEQEFYDAEDMASLENLGNHVSEEFYNSTLVESEQDRASQLEALFRVAAILCQPQTFQVKAQAIVETLVRIADADQAILRRADEDRDCLDLLASAGPGVLTFQP